MSIETIYTLSCLACVIVPIALIAVFAAVEGAGMGSRKEEELNAAEARKADLNKD